MAATKTTAPGGCLARLATTSLFLTVGLLTFYVFLLYLGQGSVRRLLQSSEPLVPATAGTAPAVVPGAPPAGGQNAGPGVPGNVGTGKALFTSQGCIGCHNPAAAGAGGAPCPNLGNIAKEADDWVKSPIYHGEAKDAPGYIRESIVAPSAFIVPGYQDGLMPQTFGTTLSNDQIQDLVAYLMTLRK